MDLNIYAQMITDNFLQLQKGDSLSINVEECDFEFAKIVAQMAISKTDVSVKIVITENGKPIDTVEFDPEPQTSFTKTTTKTTGAAFLRIAHKTREDLRHVDLGKTLDMIIDKDDFVAVQKAGHLAEPVILNRRIAIPYCVVPSISPEISEMPENFGQALEEAGCRQNQLNSANIRVLHFTGKNTDFTVNIPSDCKFFGAINRLPNGRTFVSDTNFNKLFVSADKNGISGVLEADATILGKPQKVSLKFENGLLVSHSDSKELKNLLDFDKDLAKVGFVSMDGKRFYVGLGGSLLESLTNPPESEAEIPEHFNVCPYSLLLELQGDVNVSCMDGSGRVILV